MNRETGIESAIRAHPGVREAAVFRDERNNIRALVVPDDMYLDEMLGREASEAAIVERWRKTYDLSQLTKEAASAPAGFNIVGWNSSYTRKPIPPEEMREWIEATVADILRLRPNSVYEIGCGTGLLLTRIAPHCDHYVASDVAPAVLSRVHEQLRTLPRLQNRVEILERRANDFTGLNENSFDTALLSSVVQYFPNLAYLTKVLDSAIKIVRHGGHIYIGDVRNLPLLSAFSSSVDFFQAADQTSVGDLAVRVGRRIPREPELVLSPAYFVNLRRHSPKISRVDIRPLQGRARNEMTRFRFQAILHLGCCEVPSPPIQFLDWNDRRWSLEEIRSTLRQFPSRSLGLKGIRNARIERDLEILARVDSGDETCIVGELRREFSQRKEQGIDPQDLFDLESNGLSFSVFLSWAASRHDGSYDAAFIPAQSPRDAQCPAINWPQPDSAAFARLANAPGQSKIRNDFIMLLEKHCLENLLEQSIPHDFTLVDALPRTSDGEIDACGLPAVANAPWRLY